jgi:AraC family transcriptional regulator
LGERINRARRLLANQRLSLADVAFSVGFATQSHFTVAFRKAVGVTPRHYRAAL